MSAPSTRRRLISVGTKLALGMMLVLLAASALSFVELTTKERRGLVASKRTAASMVADLLAASLSAPLDFADSDAIEAEVRNLRSNRDVVYAAVWPKGASAPAAELRAGDAPAAARARPGEVATTTDGPDYVSVVRPVSKADGRHLGAAVIVFSLAAENAAYGESRSRLLWLSLLQAGGTAAMLAAIARSQIVKPLAALAAAARRLERGGAARVGIARADELGQLSVAFDAMADAIADRERRLAEASRELQEVLDHMGQAIVVVGPDGRVEAARSRLSTRLFGRERLEGLRLVDLLYPGARPSNIEARALSEWIEAAFEIDAEQWDELSALAPSEVSLPRGGGEPASLAIELRPLPGRDGRRIMLIATDVTERRKLERDVRRKDEELARQVAATRRLLSGGAPFVSFLEATEQRLDRARAAAARPDRQVVQELFQSFHTIKGEARAFAEDALADAAQRLEQVVTPFAKGQGGPEHDLEARLAPALDEASRALAASRDALASSSPVGRAALEQISIRRDDLARLLALCGERRDEIGALVTRLASRPFGEAVGQLAEAAPSWADRLGKRARVEVEGRETPVPPRLARALPAILVHLVRNGVAHGIEAPEERAASGKPPIGLIRLSCSPSEAGPVVVVEDDGGGLDVEAISARGREMGLGEQDALALVFASGLSTATSAEDLAGLGVGLGAVKAEARRAGYEITVESRPGAGTRFVLASMKSSEEPQR